MLDFMRADEGISYKWRRFAPHPPPGKHFILIIFPLDAGDVVSLSNRPVAVLFIRKEKYKEY